MKFAFSTLGCPEWGFSDIVSTAKDFGYDGVEIRGIANEIYVPQIREFKEDMAEKTCQKLSSLGLSISCLSSACYLHKPEAVYVEQAKEYIDTAKRLGVPYVRVLGDTDPQPSKGVKPAEVLWRLMLLADYAGARNVSLLLETNGVFADSKRMKQFIKEVDSPNVGVLWDIHHPYRYFGETPEQTYENLGEYIRYIHVKDSMAAGDGVKYTMIGEGDVPIRGALAVLKKNGFDGYVTLEWLKRWYKDLSEPGIVFMQFINYIKMLYQSL